MTDPDRELAAPEGALSVEALSDRLRVAIEARRPLLEALAAEGTDCVRLLHGVAEGAPGVAIDRYGPILLVQTWRAPLPDGALDALTTIANDALGSSLTPVWNDRAGGGGSPWAGGEAPPIGHELGAALDVTPRHRGQDPYLFLDLRVARRWMRANAAGRSVLNLYAYTGGIGIAAAMGGAHHVLNVDFAESALAIARANAARNGIDPAVFSTERADAQVIARGFAGLSIEGRRRHGVRPPPKPPKKSFDLVVLDPPRWSKSAFGAVDVVRDYPSLFKPAVLCCAPGGVVLATHHVPRVEREAWHATLRRTAEKAGRALTAIEALEPEADFPSFDGKPPLKIALCRVSAGARDA